MSIGTAMTPDEFLLKVHLERFCEKWKMGLAMVSDVYAQKEQLKIQFNFYFPSLDFEEEFKKVMP